MKTSHKRLTFKIPNRLITDASLTYTARRLGAVLYAHRNALGACSKSLSRLAALAGYAVSTVREGLEALAKAGHITVQRCSRYHNKLGRLVHARSIYHCDLSFQGGYTLLPRDVLRQRDDTLAPSSFSVLMYLYQQAGNEARAYPGIRRICEVLAMGRSTVCRALQEIRKLSSILVQHCIKKNKAHTENSYHIVAVQDRPVETAPDLAPATSPIAMAPVRPNRVQKRRADVGTKVLPCSFPCCYHTPCRRLRLLCFASGGSPKISKYRLRLR